MLRGAADSIAGGTVTGKGSTVPDMYHGSCSDGPGQDGSVVAALAGETLGSQNLYTSGTFLDGAS